MPNSKQTHIFATRSDLETGLRRAEAQMELKYARVGLLYGPVFEQHLSLLQWDGLGRNTTGNHITGPCFLVIMRNTELKVEPVAQLKPGEGSGVDVPRKTVQASRNVGKSSSLKSLDECLSDLDQTTRPTATASPLEDIRYELSQKLNSDSVRFSPGGVYDSQRILVCGHIGTVSKSPNSVSLYKVFTEKITKEFEKIGNYRVGPEAGRLMDEGYRMVTISIGSPPEYDLRRQ